LGEDWKTFAHYEFLFTLTDAVEKVGWDLLASNNGIGTKCFLNQCCALDPCLESKLLAPAAKILFRQHRPGADIAADRSNTAFQRR
jgi:hypothetical protein